MMAHAMRTTVTLEPDVHAILKALMAERDITFKEAVNEAIRRGAAPAARERVRVPTRRMGRPLVNLDRALALAGDLEDEETIRKMRAGK